MTGGPGSISQWSENASSITEGHDSSLRPANAVVKGPELEGLDSSPEIGGGVVVSCVQAIDSGCTFVSEDTF